MINREIRNAQTVLEKNMFELIRDFCERSWESFNEDLVERKEEILRRFSEFSQRYEDFREFFNEKSAMEIVNSIVVFVHEYLMQRKDSIVKNMIKSFKNEFVYDDN